MRRWLAIFILFFIASPVLAAPRFIAIDILIDTPQPLAAWQFELRDLNRGMRVVGVENGASDVFGDAPYYDRDAVDAGDADRIIVADYSLADMSELPSGTIRVATIHIMIEGAEPNLDIALVNATTRDGLRIDASIRLREHEGS